MVFPWTSREHVFPLFFPPNKNVRHENSCPTLPPVAFGEMKKTGYLWTWKPWNMKVLNPQYMGYMGEITPKNEGNVGSHGIW